MEHNKEMTTEEIASYSAVLRRRFTRDQLQIMVIYRHIWRHFQKKERQKYAYRRRSILRRRNTLDPKARRRLSYIINRTTCNTELPEETSSKDESSQDDDVESSQHISGKSMLNTSAELVSSPSTSSSMSCTTPCSSNSECTPSTALETRGGILNKSFNLSEILLSAINNRTAEDIFADFVAVKIKELPKNARSKLIRQIMDLLLTYDEEQQSKAQQN